MTEAVPADNREGGASAGALLRAAREKQGIHIAVLASLIKISPSKLEALESGRFDELPDATFTRALAQTVCRTLKIDPHPVLDLLPSSGSAHLEHFGSGLRAPYRETATHADPGEWSLLNQPVFWLVALLLASAGAFWFWPARAPEPVATAPAKSPDSAAVSATGASIPSSSHGSAASSAAATTAATPAPVPAAALGPAAATPPAAVAAESAANQEKLDKAMLVLRASEPSWVEVIDGRDVLLLSRVLQSGEAIGLDARLPVKVRVGNAPATRLSFRGRDVELRASGKDNVARVELK